MTATPPFEIFAASSLADKFEESTNFAEAAGARIFGRASIVALNILSAAGSSRLPLTSSWQNATNPLPDEMKNRGEYARSIPQTSDIL